MSVLIPKDRRCTTHVFCLHQLMAMLHAAGHIKLPPETRIIGSAVDQYGNLEVGFEYGASYHGPNSQPIVVRHDFSEELALQAQIAADAEAGKLKLMEDLVDKLDDIQDGRTEGLKTCGTDFRRMTERVMEDQRFEAEQQAKLQEEMDQAVPLAEEVRSEHTAPSPREVGEHLRHRVKDLYPKAHPEKTFTPYAFVFQGSALERDPSEVVLPFIPGEPPFNILGRLRKIAHDREMSLRLYECLDGIVRRVHNEGTLATAEAAKVYLRPENYLIVLPTEEAAKKAA